jgi:soluble lytic murein transglycosylase-like protein
MTGVQKAIIPGILLTCLFLFFVNRQVNPPLPAIAATEEKQSSPKNNSKTGTCQYFDRYPEKIQPWCGLIEPVADEYNLDPLLIAAVMLVESGGQPEVISHSGAVGLLQVMPSDGIASTFEGINGPCFASRPSIEELKVPAFNIDYGTRMLSGLLARSGNLRDALKSYGPYDVDYAYADKVLSIYNRFLEN